MRGKTPNKILRAAAGVVVLLGVTPTPGRSQVVPGPGGPVEFIGLQRWEAQELFDAIRDLAPDLPFHACATVMRRNLGFADAAAMRWRIDQSDEWYTVVVGLEDSARVRYRPTGSETLDLPETWVELLAATGDDPYTQSVVARAFPASGYLSNPDGPRRVAEQMGADPESVERVWELVASADGEEDRRLSHEVLARDSSLSARVAATLVLGNFMDDDRSWHALVNSVIDPHPFPPGQQRGPEHARRHVRGHGGGPDYVDGGSGRLVGGPLAAGCDLRGHQSVRVQLDPAGPGRHGH
ncbi:MAG: hypothetical protein F4087_15795 [Gemmatimonadetes bacterium]|nr:hypothetical protein [Gemmatimonadota bacterium]MYE70615.1 hypothetical protein [Gemmatimonadota bacterium]MYJ69953.1 hypothetical protein [Gemmatimonadota bacterium]